MKGGQQPICLLANIGKVTPIDFSELLIWPQMNWSSEEGYANDFSLE